MKQVIIKKGKAMPYELPETPIRDGFVKIKVLYSCISVGTELMGVKNSGKGLVKKALENPKKVIQVFKSVQKNGFRATKNEVITAKEFITSTGYSLSGRVTEIGKGVKNFQIGDLVSAGGAGFAVHSEYVVVPKNLVVKVPCGVSAAEASTGTVGSIALHGIRRADLKIGEYAVVLGVGLLGLLTVQMLVSSGVRVAAIDIGKERLELAKKFGAEITINSVEEEPVNAIKNWTSGFGADAVLFLAATSSSKPLSSAFQMTRKKGRVVLVGVSGMEIDRNDIYKNEIDFIISSSYGPGRYDDSYESKGIDYPYAFVRWTENRNIQEFLRLVKENGVNLQGLNFSIIELNELEDAYNKLETNNKNILTLIKYPEIEEQKRITSISVNSQKSSSGRVTVGIIGAGGFTVGTILPILFGMSTKYQLKTIVNRTSSIAVNVAKQFEINNISSDVEDIFNDKEMDLVLITTRHGSHAELVIKGLESGKNVFVEKPLATNIEQLLKIKDFFSRDKSHKPMLFVGFNRRFSKYAIEIRRHIENRTSALFMHYRMNAGFIPHDSWIHEDGGRIVGEACHIIDLMVFLTNSRIKELSVNKISPDRGQLKSNDNKSITFIFEDGSLGVLDYFSSGSKLLSKEYLEIHYDNKSIIMDDYKKIEGYGVNVKKLVSNSADKGHKDEWKDVYESLKTGHWPISFDDLAHITETSIFASEI